MKLTTALLVVFAGSITAGTIAPPRSGGTWTQLPNITLFDRQEHSTVAIGNTIYIVGGIAPIANSTADPTTPIVQSYSIPHQTWTLEAPLPKALNHPNTAVVNGKIYVLGGLAVGPGQWPNWLAAGDCYVYNPATHTWKSLGNMPIGTARGAAAVGVHGDTIYVGGGLSRLGIEGQETLDITSSYNTRTGAWTSLPPLPEKRDHAGGALIDGVFYVVGGRINGTPEGMRDTVFALDVTCSPLIWKTRKARMPTRKGGLAVGVVGDVIVAVGGEGNVDAVSGVFNQTEAYDTKRDVWTKMTPMRVPRHGTAGVGVGNGVFIPGGGVVRQLGATSYFDVFKV
ncbi:Kelch motif [Glarea lozoyensis ATCC 20868]|uniref:Kelch motif n=2 Tax=Glarea lozoyensis TaxID=101852 RepID=S3CZJ5_GLAL2|nr:Kelch motif [Glarea lozoyensis ATCC 20868]EHK96097.1 putative Kelch domain-containing protein 8B [Glarea lozoyensis 74030]EPE30294.1 Kelch motif [Glarea lozoyensis ATCC 20868]